MVIWSYISIITLSRNRLNGPTETQTGWMDTNTRTYDIYCLQETHFRPRDTYRLNVRGWKKIFHANGNQKKAGIAIFISDKIDLKIKKITRDKEEHYLIIKGSIQEEDVNNCKYLFTQHRSTSIHKTNTNRHKRRNWQ